MTTPDDFPATSMRELDDAAKGVAWLVLSALVVLGAWGALIAWLIQRAT